jgi:hypothetical protein
MGNLAERIVLIIIREEMRRHGCIALDGLAERLALYLSEAEQAQLLADAARSGAEPSCSLEEAFLWLLPVDQSVTACEGGLRLEPLHKQVH